MKYPQQRGPLTGRQEFRYGYGEFPNPGGMNTDSDPASIKPWEFVSAINVDFEGNAVKDRPGVVKLNPSTLHAANARHHPMLFEFGTPFRLWAKGDGCPGKSATGGFYLSNLDFEQEPQFQRVAWFESAVTSVHIAGYGGVPYVGIDSKLYRLQLIPVRYGDENIVLSGVPAVEVHTFTGFTVSFLREFDGFLFIGLNAGAASKIARFDGRTVNDGTGGTTADLTGINPPLAAGVWRDNLVVGFDIATGHIRLRARGATPSWTTVAGAIATAPGNTIVSYKDNLYGASGSTYIWRHTGSGAPASFHTPASATLVESLAEGEDVAGLKYLFYGYGTGSAGIIGRYDNSAFSDVHKNLTAQLSTVRRVRGLAWFKSNLAAAANTTTAGAQVFVSRARDTSGTYDQFNPAPTNNGDIHQFEVI